MVRARAGPLIDTKIAFRAAVHSFHERESEQNATEPEDFKLSDSTILNYTGIEKREGLAFLGKRLVDGKSKYSGRFTILHHTMQALTVASYRFTGRSLFGKRRIPMISRQSRCPRSFFQHYLLL